MTAKKQDLGFGAFLRACKNTLLALDGTQKSLVALCFIFTLGVPIAVAELWLVFVPYLVISVIWFAYVMWRIVKEEGDC